MLGWRRIRVFLGCRSAARGKLRKIQNRPKNKERNKDDNEYGSASHDFMVTL